MPLRTDYTNDILDTSKNTERKYNIKNSNGTIVEENVTFEDVTDYSQEGSRFGASDINAITTRVNQLTASDGLDFRFATDGEGNYGYLGADDSFNPFSGINEVVEIYSNSGTVLKYNWTPSETQKSTYKYFLFIGVAYTYSASNNSYLTVTVDGVNPIINITKHNGTYNTDEGSRDLNLAIVDSKKTNQINVKSNWKAITYIYGIK